MLDKRTTKLLFYLVHVCDDGGFKIIETEDLLKNVSKKAALDELKPMLKFLKDNEMIDIKYSDEAKYCLSVLPKGRVYIESYSGKKREITVSRRLAAFIIAGSFVAALVGTILAEILINMLG